MLHFQFSILVIEKGTGCPGRLWSLLLWRYSRPAWTRSCAAYCRWPCFGRGVGLDDPQRSLPTPTILWFCDSVILWFCDCFLEMLSSLPIAVMGMITQITSRSFRCLYLSKVSPTFSVSWFWNVPSNTAPKFPLKILSCWLILMPLKSVFHSTGPITFIVILYFWKDIVLLHQNRVSHF